MPCSFAYKRVDIISLYVAHHRKRLLLIFAALGSLSSLVFLILPSSSVIWPTSAFLAIVANVSFGTSAVSLNSYLPQLARGEESVKEALNKMTRLPRTSSSDDPEADDHEVDDERAPLTQQHGNSASSTSTLVSDSPELQSYNQVLSRAISRISSRGIATGYSAGIILLLIILIPVTLLHGSTFSMRLAIGLTGAWWGFFTIPAAMWLPNDAGPPVPGIVSREEETPYLADGEEEEKQSVMRQILAAWRRLGHMLRPKEIAKLRNTFWFLLAWFLLSDGE